MTNKLNPSASKRNLLDFKQKSRLKIPHLLYFALTPHCGYISLKKTSVSSVPPCEIQLQKTKKDIDKITKKRYENNLNVSCFIAFVSYLLSNSCKDSVRKVLTKVLKGHLQQAKRALLASCLVVFIKSACDFFFTANKVSCCCT